MAEKFLWAQVVDSELGDEGVVVGALKEGSHKISNELIEKILAGRIYYKSGTISEELGLTFTKVDDDPGQKELKRALQEGKEVKVWLGSTKLDPVTQKHKVLFAFTIGEEFEDAWEEEEDTVELTLKVQIRSVEMEFPKLPDSVLNPADSIPVVPELPGDSTGELDNRQVATPTEPVAGA
ncbi:hypothetical protein ETI10_01745 [Macrococcoides goetzii]|nr:hypothetical protein [Macrococcus goetzii]TDM41834.1 hypothetical protein ETI10_01745 [Macrococcus goetzii]